MTDPHWPTLLSAWTTAPVANTIVGVLTAAYLCTFLVQRRHGRRWPVSRVMGWIAAVACLIIALNSPLGTYARSLFWVHMVVHLLLITVIPALLVAAQPIRLLLQSTAGSVHRRLTALIDGRGFQIATRPAVTVSLYTAVLVGTHLTGFQKAMAHHVWIHHAEIVVYLVSGYALLLPLIGNEYVGRHLPFALRAATVVTCMVPDAIVGVTLMVSPHLVAPGYQQSRQGWGPSALSDQTAAGAIMWVVGDGLMMVLILLIVREWVATEESSLGRWLDGVRQRATVGEHADSLVNNHSIDNEDAVLDAYNARLAVLNNLPQPNRMRKDDR